MAIGADSGEWLHEAVLGGLALGDNDLEAAAAGDAVADGQLAKIQRQVAMAIELSGGLRSRLTVAHADA